MQRLRTRLRAGASTFPSATFALNFLTGGLDPAVTFSRGSNATLVDSTGKITYAPANLLTYSEQFDNAAWEKTAISVTANATTAPDGTGTADTLIPTASLSVHRVRQPTLTLSGGVATYSIYVKANGYTKVALREGQTSGASAAFDLSGSGSLIFDNSTGGVTVSNSTITDAGGGWFRIATTFTGATSQRFDFLVLSPDYTSGAVTGTWTADGTSGIFLWGAQLEPVTYQTTAGPYVATTASAYYAPRFDYDPVTLAAKGLLIEEQRTNLLLQSENFSVSWGTSSLTVTTNTTVAPDGTTTADTLTPSTTSGIVSQSPTFTGDGTKSVSVFLKAGTSGTTVFFLRDTTAVATRGTATITWTAGVPSAVASSGGTIEAVENYGNGWYRIKLILAGVIAANVNSLRIQPDSVVGTGTVIAWGAQAENGAFATSYIPTVASQVTRTADQCSIVAPNFASWYNQSEGTLVSEFSSFSPTSTGTAAWTISDGTNSNRWFAFAVSSSIRHFMATGGVTQASIDVGTYAANTVFKSAMAISANSVQAAVNGTLGTEDTTATVPTVVRLTVGSSPIATSNFLNGHVRQIAYYNTRLPDATLQSLTA